MTQIEHTIIEHTATALDLVQEAMSKPRPENTKAQCFHCHRSFEIWPSTARYGNHFLCDDCEYNPDALKQMATQMTAECEAALEALPDRPKQYPACAICQDRGWLPYYNADCQITEIRRCESCIKFESDAMAGSVAASTITIRL